MAAAAATVGFGIMSDSVYGGTCAGTATSIQLTTSWGVNAAFEHNWNPHWQTSVYGAYVATSYNSQANAMLCVAETAHSVTDYAGTAAAWLPLAATTTGQCGTLVPGRNGTSTARLISVSTLCTRSSRRRRSPDGAGSRSASANSLMATRTIADQSSFMAQFRVHRNFYP